MKKGLYALIAFAVFLALLVATGSIFTVREDRQVILTQFGKPVGDPITEPVRKEGPRVGWAQHPNADSW